MKRYETEAFLKSFLIFFISLSLLSAIIAYHYFKERVHFIQDTLKQEMWIYNYNFQNQKFDIDFIDKKPHLQIGKLYMDNEIYILFPIQNADNQLLKIIYPLKNYNNDVSKIKKDVLIKYIIFTFIILIFSIAYALYALYPLHYALNLLNEFLKDIIHDLNTPVASMLLNIKGLKKKLNSSHIERLELSAKNIGNLYKNLELFLKDIPLSKEKIKIDELIKERSKFFKAIYPHINFSLHLNKKECYCPKEAISRIIDNLLSNACKYNKKPYLVKITLKENKLVIEDSGIGIKNPAKAFNRYYKEGERGLGIGLNIVKKLCKKLDIDIKINSIKNRGTTVKLIFQSLLFILYIFSSPVLYANESLPHLIEQMKKADIKERYIYMNKIKMRLRQMNQKERVKVIKEMKRSFNKQTNRNHVMQPHKMQNHFNHTKPFKNPSKGHNHGGKH